MSYTALAWLLVYIAAALFSFVNPVFGMFGYLHEYYLRPDLHWWGKTLPAMRWNLIISVIFGLTFVVRRNSLRELRRVPNPILPWLLSLLAVMLLVSVTVSVNTVLSWAWMIKWAKMALIIPLLIIGTIRSRNAFNVFVVANMAGAFEWGLEAWLDPDRKAGRLLNVGSGDSLNDNAASAHLLTVLPFIIVYLLTEKDKRLRAVALIALPFVVNTIILCNSRGAMVGMLVAGAFAFMRIRRGYRVRLTGAALAVGVAFLLLADPQYIMRQQTTTNYETDGSAQQRLESWLGGWALIKDRPWGAGGRGFHLLSPRYIPSIVEKHNGDLRAPHNTYVMVASEWGVLGIICYLGAIVSAFKILRVVQANAHGDNFYYWRAFAVQSGLTAVLVAGTFTDRLYSEAPYWMMALSFVLYRLQITEQAGANVVRAADPPVGVQRALAPLAAARAS
jgi:putative inorganic carbon (hco3(-)) transporter